MPMQPNQFDDLAFEVWRIYADAEYRILLRVVEQLQKGIDLPDWQLRKLAELQKLRQAVGKELDRAYQEVVDVVYALLAEAYSQAMIEADNDLAPAMIEGRIPPDREGAVEAQGAFGLVNADAVRAMAAAQLQRIKDSHLAILRNVDDAYRKVIYEAASTVSTGINTRIQATQLALNRFADEGIKGFVDSKGRRWDIASYAEMAIRTAVTRASVQGHMNRLAHRGHDLVRVSDHPQECPLCRPWEGKILSISGTHPIYPSVSVAISSGLFHANCGHRFGAYIPGLSKPRPPQPDPKGYEQRLKQRYLERQIRKWKRREAVAITDEEKAKARAKVRYWQAELRRFLADTGRPRDRHREQIMVGTAGRNRSLPSLASIRAAIRLGRTAAATTIEDAANAWPRLGAAFAAASRGESLNGFNLSDEEQKLVLRQAQLLQWAAESVNSGYRVLYLSLPQILPEKGPDAYRRGQTVVINGLTAAVSTPEAVSAISGDTAAAVIRIEDKSGIRGFVRGGGEVILPHGAKYRVADIREEDGVLQIVLRP